MTDVVLRPLDGWTLPRTTRRKSAPFRAGWADTKALLATEVGHLGGRRVVVEVDFVNGEGAFRVDGSLRANAKTTDFPGVRVSFDSRHGTLTYATDRYEYPYAGQAPSWQANARAIALSLAALRAVDRYGVTRSGEQYTGWKQLGGSAPTTEDLPTRRVRAARLLVEYGGDQSIPPATLLLDPDLARRLFGRAARKHHPDAGGDHDLFVRLVAARDLLTEGQQ